MVIDIKQSNDKLKFILLFSHIESFWCRDSNTFTTHGEIMRSGFTSLSRLNISIVAGRVNSSLNTCGDPAVLDVTRKKFFVGGKK